MSAKKTLAQHIKQIRDLLDELEDVYNWDIEEMQQVIDEKTDLLDKYVSEADVDDN